MKKWTETFVALTIWIVLGAITIATLLGLITVVGKFFGWVYHLLLDYIL